MQNWERSEFDEQWKAAFAKVEVAPPPVVWVNLDHELTIADSDEDKRRIIFYQRLAAACVLFALVAGSFGIYHWRQSDVQMVERTPMKSGERSKVNQAAKGKGEEPGAGQLEASGSIAAKEVVKDLKFGKNSSQKNQSTAITTENSSAVANNAVGESQIVSLRDGKQSGNARNWIVANTDLPSLALLPTAELQGEPRYVEIVRKLPYIPSAFMNEGRKEKFNHEKLWASVSAASGVYSESSGSSFNSSAASRVYSSGFQTASPAASISSPAVSAPTVGRSYSYGVVGGMRVAKRWVVQTGVQYLNQAIENSSVANSSFNSGGSIVSTNEFVSVPMQAGYLLVDRKIGWQLNPGMATDFFVKNTTSNQLLSVSQGGGADSPYRSVNFAGLMSSEFSYKLGKNYRLSLLPGVRYSFNPVLKSQPSGSAVAWDLAFRFRYIFK